MSGWKRPALCPFLTSSVGTKNVKGVPKTVKTKCRWLDTNIKFKKNLLNINNISADTNLLYCGLR